MNPLRHPAAHQIPENDVEKRGQLKESAVDITLSGSDSADNTLQNPEVSYHPATSDIAPTPVLLRGRLARWNAKVEGLAGLGTHVSSLGPDPESCGIYSRDMSHGSICPPSEAILTSKP